VRRCGRCGCWHYALHAPQARRTSRDALVCWLIVLERSIAGESARAAGHCHASFVLGSKAIHAASHAPGCAQAAFVRLRAQRNCVCYQLTANCWARHNAVTGLRGKSYELPSGRDVCRQRQVSGRSSGIVWTCGLVRRVIFCFESCAESLRFPLPLLCNAMQSRHRSVRTSPATALGTRARTPKSTLL